MSLINVVTLISLEIFCYGTALDMIHTYVNECQDQPSYYNHKNWYRNNDVKVHEAGRYKFMDLFFGFNHPIYQEIEYRELSQKIVMPAEILEQRNKNLTYTISEKEGKHQVGDFILEGKVRR